MCVFFLLFFAIQMSKKVLKNKGKYFKKSNGIVYQQKVDRTDHQKSYFDLQIKILLQKIFHNSDYIQIRILSQIDPQLIRTVKFTATYLKCVSSLDFSLTATWAGHWLLGRPKQLKREKSRAESQQQILPTTNKCPYQM